MAPVTEARVAELLARVGALRAEMAKEADRDV